MRFVHTSWGNIFCLRSEYVKNAFNYKWFPCVCVVINWTMNCCPSPKVPKVSPCSCAIVCTHAHEDSIKFDTCPVGLNHERDQQTWTLMRPWSFAVPGPLEPKECSEQSQDCSKMGGWVWGRGDCSEIWIHLLCFIRSVRWTRAGIWCALCRKLLTYLTPHLSSTPQPDLECTILECTISGFRFAETKTRIRG